MSTWITLTADHVATRLAGPELSAFKAAALGAGQTSAGIVTDVLSQVTEDIRGSCAVKFELGAAGTIPGRLLGVAVDLARYRLATRLPGMKSLIDDLRQKEYDQAQQRLKDVALGNFAIEDPAGTTTDTSAPSPSFGTKTLRYQRRNGAGL